MTDHFERIIDFMRNQGVADADMEGHVYHRYLNEDDPRVKSQLLGLLTMLVGRPRPQADGAALKSILSKLRGGYLVTEEALELMQTTSNAFSFFVRAFESESDPSIKRRLAQLIIRYRAYGPALSYLT